jgi:VIT1/CCC1 family predicted Fe2+/Mn2+ transporter
MSGTWKRLQDWLTVVIGVLLFIAPFALGATANQAAAWSAWIAGILAVVLAASVVPNQRDRQQFVGQR